MVWGWRLLHRAGHHVHSQNVRFWHTRHYLRMMLPLFVRCREKGGTERADKGTWASKKIKPNSPPFLCSGSQPSCALPPPDPLENGKTKKKAFCPLEEIKRPLCFSKGAFDKAGFCRKIPLYIYCWYWMCWTRGQSGFLFPKVTCVGHNQ